MLIIHVDTPGKEEACWRYAYMTPKQEDLDELRAKVPGGFVTEVALVFFEGDHADLHKFFDARFPEVAALLEKESRRKFHVVRDNTETEG